MFFFFLWRSAGFWFPNRALVMRIPRNKITPIHRLLLWVVRLSRWFIAHNVKVSVQSQREMHQDNHCGICFSHRQRADNVCEIADNPNFSGRICPHNTKKILFFADNAYLILRPAPLLLNIQHTTRAAAKMNLGNCANIDRDTSG